MNDLISIPFHDHTIYAALGPDGRPMVPLKQFSDRLGLNWKTQHEKLTARKSLWGVVILRIPSGGGEQETTCIPANRLAAWLFSIHAAKVKPQYRAALERYQIEAADVLDRHFFGGRGAFELAKSLLLASRPRWNTIARLREAGVRRDQIAVTMNLSRPVLHRELQLMADCGITGRPPEPGSWDDQVENDPILRAAKAAGELLDA